MSIHNHWTPLHDAAWKGDEERAKRLLHNFDVSLSSGQSPLYLALSRWISSPQHQNLLETLWRADPAPQLARWGDTAWGGDMTLLELAVERDAPAHIQHCRTCGMQPRSRTWSIALLHDSDRPMITLGLLYDPPSDLPMDLMRVRRMLSERQAAALEDAQGDNSTGGGSSRSRRL